MVGPAAEPCRAVPLAKPCLPKPPELRDLELAKWHLMMCSTDGRSEEADYIFYLEPDKLESGKGKCSYDPKVDTVSALINEELYAGVYIDFMGTDAAIFRTMGKQTAMRTDQYNSRWLNDPAFVRAQLIPDSSERNDDKLYFFFREKSADAPLSPGVYSRIGRICLNDDGGHCCLVNKWSTFLKARLVCSVPGPDGIETHFDELQDVFIQQTQDTKNPVIYAVFSASGSVFKGSAVCVYSMADIRMVFNRGTVQKVIVLPRDDMETEELMLEEIEVFKPLAGLKAKEQQDQKKPRNRRNHQPETYGHT
ncbi:PREDICTED: semaphorin-3F [Pygoscelis adeliae]|uniref:semaphorin-3F n=1 Tax=Pygoscelis adeliae TaxID=9238 RepID=UPI0004F4F019|nr:PREDICTED: semaphorin-3F [Pygoscelis adeliae]